MISVVISVHAVVGIFIPKKMCGTHKLLHGYTYLLCMITNYLPSAIEMGLVGQTTIIITVIVYCFMCTCTVE